MAEEPNMPAGGAPSEDEINELIRQTAGDADGAAPPPSQSEPPADADAEGGTGGEASAEPPPSEADLAALEAVRDSLREVQSEAGNAAQKPAEPQTSAAEDAALAAVRAAVAMSKNPQPAPQPSVSPAAPASDPQPDPQQAAAAAFTPPVFEPISGADAPTGIDLLDDINLNVKIELGRTRMLIEDVLKLGEGAVVELDKLAGDPVDVFVNERHVARGEVLVLNDNFCVRISEIMAGVADQERG